MARKTNKHDDCEKGQAASRQGRPREEVSTHVLNEQTSDVNVYLIPVVVFAIVFLAVIGVFYLATKAVDILAVVIAGVIALAFASSIHIAQEWERVAVLRLGKLNRICGPGCFFIIPLIESCTIRVDQRIRVTRLSAKETLTADLIPLDVDAVMYWMVWGVKEACIEVSDFVAAVENAGQVILRDAIGRSTVSAITIKREQLDHQLLEKLEEQVSDWGITVLSVSLRNILVPKELQDAMSLEAQTDQRCKARIMLAESEQDIYDALEEVGEKYQENDGAMRLRAMHLLFESIRETGGTVVLPSSFSEGFNDILPDDLPKKMRNDISAK